MEWLSDLLFHVFTVVNAKTVGDLLRTLPEIEIQDVWP
jgi:hypothetical protein